eukprot:COSAG02_NODE_71_length_42019_cov_36.443893_6_plen_244_part_00
MIFPFPVPKEDLSSAVHGILVCSPLPVIEDFCIVSFPGSPHLFLPPISRRGCVCVQSSNFANLTFLPMIGAIGIYDTRAQHERCENGPLIAALAAELWPERWRWEGPEKKAEGAKEKRRRERRHDALHFRVFSPWLWPPPLPPRREVWPENSAGASRFRSRTPRGSTPATVPPAHAAGEAPETGAVPHRLCGNRASTRRRAGRKRRLTDLTKLRSPAGFLKYRGLTAQATAVTLSASPATAAT